MSYQIAAWAYESFYHFLKGNCTMIGSVSMACSGTLTPSQIDVVQDDFGATISGAWDFCAICC